jgi:hypothetical protein
LIQKLNGGNPIFINNKKIIIKLLNKKENINKIIEISWIIKNIIIFFILLFKIKKKVINVKIIHKIIILLKINKIKIK